MLPKLYNGKDQTFFFVDYEGYRRDSQQLAARQYSHRADAHAAISARRATIYDPLTTRANPNGSGFIRDPFAGNQIPATRWDPIAAKMINAYPTPTSSGRFNNYLANLAQTSELESGRCSRRSPDHRRRTISSRASPFRIRKRMFPALIRRSRIPGISQPVNLGDEARLPAPRFSPRSTPWPVMSQVLSSQAGE